MSAPPAAAFAGKAMASKLTPTATEAPPFANDGGGVPAGKAIWAGIGDMACAGS